MTEGPGRDEAPGSTGDSLTRRWSSSATATLPLTRPALTGSGSSTPGRPPSDAPSPATPSGSSNSPAVSCGTTASSSSIREEGRTSALVDVRQIDTGQPEAWSVELGWRGKLPGGVPQPAKAALAGPLE